MRLEIQKDTAYTFEWSFFDKNIQEIPVSGTITVNKPGGTALVASTAVSIETDGTIKYTLASSNTGTVDRNYRIALTYQIGDVTYRPFYLFDIVETPIMNLTRDEDLFLHVPELRAKSNTIVTETTAAGTTETLISTNLNSYNMDFKGGSVEIYIDDTTVHRAEVTTWEEALSRITFSPGYTSIIGNSLTINLRSSYQRYIDEAFSNFVIRDIRNKVGIAAGYIDSDVVRNLTVFKTLEIISFSRVEEEGDKWSIRAAKFADLYQSEMIKLDEPYDRDEDGHIDLYEDNDRILNSYTGVEI